MKSLNSLVNLISTRIFFTLVSSCFFLEAIDCFSVTNFYYINFFLYFVTFLYKNNFLLYKYYYYCVIFLECFNIELLLCKFFFIFLF